MPTEFKIEIAQKVIKISAVNDFVKEYCKDFLTEKKADFSIEISQNDILSEQTKTGVTYSEPYLETLAVYRKISEIMPYYNTILFHGSVVAVDGVGYMFTAKSGVGKSTHTRLWREYFGERAFMVNDDKPMIMSENGEISAFGTPWNGKHKLSANCKVPLKAICYLTRGENNHIERITPQEIYPILLQQSYRPHDIEAYTKSLKIIDEIMNNVKFYKLACNISSQAVEIAYNGMKENTEV